MKEHIRTFFDQQAILTEEEWGMFKSVLKERRFEKGEYLIKEGETEKYLSFIISGAARMFLVKPDGSDISVHFCFENQFISSYASFLTEAPSAFYIQAVQPCHVFSVSRSDLNLAYNISQTGERLGRLNAENLSIILEQRMISLLSESATERYTRLIEQHPYIFRHIQLKHVASFLGITPESLSRIRKKLLVPIS